MSPQSIVQQKVMSRHEIGTTSVDTEAFRPPVAKYPYRPIRTLIRNVRYQYRSIPAPTGILNSKMLYNTDR